MQAHATTAATTGPPALPQPAYLLQGRRIEPLAPGFAESLAQAHAQHLRPLCLCQAGGVAMYVATLGDGFIVKRMPFTGSQHAPDCASYEPPAELSGLGQVLGTAIVEDPATGTTTLKLDFALTRLPGRHSAPPTPGHSERAQSRGPRLGLRALLHYLWHQAQLTRWHPSFAGKRHWATVRRHLLQAAEGMLAQGQPLLPRLYIPEVFSVEQRHELNARRQAQWAQASAPPGQPQRLMLLVGEVKAIAPARYGHRLVIKHLPDQAFALDAALYRSLCRQFEPELALWGTCDALHLVAMATFGISPAGVPTVAELCLMPTTAQWLPVENEDERVLVERLVREGRRFWRNLRFGLARGDARTCVVVEDGGAQAAWDKGHAGA